MDGLERTPKSFFVASVFGVGTSLGICGPSFEVRRGFFKGLVARESQLLEDVLIRVQLHEINEEYPKLCSPQH